MVDVIRHDDASFDQFQPTRRSKHLRWHIPICQYYKGPLALPRLLTEVCQYLEIQATPVVSSKPQCIRLHADHLLMNRSP